MLSPHPGEPRGVLHGLPDGVVLSRWLPSPDLAPFVQHLWIVEWDLRGRSPHVQDVLTHPSVHLSVEAGRTEVVGVSRVRFTRTIEGEGIVVAARFRPGGFRPFLGSPVSALTGRAVPAGDVLPIDADDLERRILAPGTAPERAARLEDTLRAIVPARDPLAEVLARVVASIAEDPAAGRVEDLASRLGVGVRRLQRLFDAYVGVGPKWVLQRARLHEATARAAAGTAVDWAALAAELGYCDQAHLVRDFRAAVGEPPGRYAAGGRPR